MLTLGLIKRKHLKFILIIIPTLLIIAFALTYIPHHIVSIDPSNVSKIAIFDGNTGKSIEITDPNDTKLIINNLSGITFQKGKMSFGYMGYRFNTKIYDQMGKLYKELTINSDDTIRYKGFFYRAVDDTIAYDYIDELVQE